MTRYAVRRAQAAARMLCQGKCPNPEKCKGWKDPRCDEVEIQVTCDAAAKKLFEKGIWTDAEGNDITVDPLYRKGCGKICGKKITKKCN